MNKTSFFTYLDGVLREATNSKLQKKLNKLQDILLEILPEYHDIALEVINRHRYEARTTLKINATKRSRVKRDIEPSTKCMARIGLGTQCSRSRSVDSDFCKSHDVSRPYGRIDMSEPPGKKMAKRRGRRGKAGKEYTVEDLDLDSYVQAILININGESYLMDQNNILYQFNSNNEIVGRVIDGKVEWY
jgi:hypothetical protein